MRRHEFEKALTQKSLPKAMMFFGQNYFLLKDAVKSTASLWDEDDNRRVLYSGEYDFASAKSYLAEQSLFGDSNLLIVHTEKKIAKKELDKLIEITTRNQKSYFIYAYYGDDYRGSNSAFLRKKEAGEVRFFDPSFSESTTILRNRAKELNLNIEEYAISHLLLTQNGNLELSYNALLQLQLLPMTITPKVIDEHIYPLATVKLDSMILLTLQKKSITDTLQKLLESGEDETRIITGFSNYIYQLILFNLYIKINGFSDSKAILGYKLPPQIEEERTALAIKLKLTALKAMLAHLLEVELLLKNEQKIDRSATLHSALIKLKSFL